MFFLISGLIGVVVGWGLAYFRGRPVMDQLHRAAVFGLIFALLAVLYVVIVGWIAMG